MFEHIATNAEFWNKQKTPTGTRPAGGLILICDGDYLFFTQLSRSHKATKAGNDD